MPKDKGYDEHMPERIIPEKMAEVKGSWDTGPAGGAKTGEVPGSIPKVEEAAHNR